MCGIAGWKTLDGARLSKAGMQFMEAVLLESQIRGKHATGFAYASEGALHSAKAPLPADEFIFTEDWQRFMRKRPAAAILHTRYSTSGPSEDNANNQPLLTQDIALVHNGLVSQDTPEHYAEQYTVHVETENDSEVLLNLVDVIKGHFDISLSGAVAGALKKVRTVEDPIFAMAVLHKDGEIVLSRDHLRPLWTLWIEELNVEVFASTRDILQRALHRCRLKVDKFCIQIPSWATQKLASCEVPRGLKFKHPSLMPLKAAPMLPRLKGAQNRSVFKLHPEPLPMRHFNLPEDIEEAFIQYYAAIVFSWEVDVNYPLLEYLFQRYELSREQQYWWCWLYGVFYHPGTLFWFAQEFPDFEKVDVGRLEKWHAENWQKLRYNTDRKYEKGHLVEMFVSYRDAIGDGTQEEFFQKCIPDFTDPVANFHSVWKQLIKLTRFGRYATYIYTEALARCMGLPIEADTIFLKEAASSRSGLCYAIGKPDLAAKGVSFPPEAINALDKKMRKMMKTIQERYPDLPVDFWLMESVLCAFKGFFRTTKGRYIGYYIDRNLQEINEIPKTKDRKIMGVDWKVLRDFRRERLMPELLGEIQEKPWTGIQKHLEHTFAETGQMVNLSHFMKPGRVLYGTE